MKKRKILALVLACATLLSLVGCGNTATTNETEKDTTVTESENTETAVDLDAWEKLSITIDNATVTIGTTLNTPTFEFTLNGKTGPTNLFQLLTKSTPNQYGWCAVDVGIIDKTTITKTDNGISINTYDIDINDIRVYCPTDNTDIYSQAIMYMYDFVLPIETIYAANKGEVKIPEIILPNGLQVGQYLQNGCPEIIAAYGEPNEINQTTAEYGNGEEYVYISEDGTKKFAVYTTSSQLVGFRMYIDFKTLDCYNH